MRENHSGVRPKTVRLPPGIPVRLQPGILFANQPGTLFTFARNPQGANENTQPDGARGARGAPPLWPWRAAGRRVGRAGKELAWGGLCRARETRSSLTSTTAHSSSASWSPDSAAGIPPTASSPRRPARGWRASRSPRSCGSRSGRAADTTGSGTPAVEHLAGQRVAQQVQPPAFRLRDLQPLEVGLAMALKESGRPRSAWWAGPDSARSAPWRLACYSSAANLGRARSLGRFPPPNSASTGGILGGPHRRKARKFEQGWVIREDARKRAHMATSGVLRRGYVEKEGLGVAPQVRHCRK